MFRGNAKKRVKQMAEVQMARIRMASANANTGLRRQAAIELSASPPPSPLPAKRQRTIKAEDEDVLQIPRNPADLPADVLALDPKSQESDLPALNNEQYEALKVIMSGRNTFLTGSAGCGKSTVIRWVVMLLRAAGKKVWITAPTGQAACQVGGTTLHSYVGWNTDVQKLRIKDIEKNAKNTGVLDRIQKTEVLIIDEISMVERNTLDRLNRAMQTASGNDQDMFGGKHIIFCGDFFQLAPVKPFETCYDCGRVYEPKARQDARRNGKAVKVWECTRCSSRYEPTTTEFWAFNSEVWQDSDFNLAYVHLQQNHRQNEGLYMDMLARCRVGKDLTPTDLALILRPDGKEDGVRLYSTKLGAKLYNAERLSELPREAIAYNCYDGFVLQPAHRATLDARTARSETDGTLIHLTDHRHPIRVLVKVGMPMILQANLDVERGLVNGSQCVVVGFESHPDMMVPSAAGIDRTPGTEGELANVESAYIARKGFGEYAAHRNEQCKNFASKAGNNHHLWPVVHFNNGLRVTIFANCAMTLLGEEKPYSLEMRTQLPLAPGWAMTVHKAQGMTLERVVVGMAQSSLEGLAYVALSRAKTLDGLRVSSLGKSLGKGANQQVLDFYETTIWDVGGFRVPDE